MPRKIFEKGHDPRRNLKGRPRSFDQVRELAQAIAKEKVTKDGAPVLFNGRQLTVIEAILRKWAQSNTAHLQEMFVQYAYGKVPQPVDVRGDQTVRFVFDDVLTEPGQDTDA